MNRTILTALVCLILGLSAGFYLAGNRGAQPAAGPEPSTATTGTADQRKIAYYKDPMHPWYTSDKPGKAPDCGMDLVPVYEGADDIEGVKIDPVVVQNIGVRTEEVTLRELKRVIRAPGRIEMDETRTYSVNTKFSGWVEKLYADYTGMPVRKGQPLMELYSPDLLTAQEEYIQALGYRDNLQTSGGGADALEGAENLVRSARNRLMNWDISPEQIKSLEERRAPVRNMIVYSPATGIVLAKDVSEGRKVMEGTEIYRIVDLSQVWTIAEVYQNELAWVSPGQTAEIEVSYLKGRIFSGKITYIYPELNQETRTARLRIELPNSSGLELKPGMFVSVRIESPASGKSVAVPEQAIIRSGERNIAVMALGGGYFEPREVRLGFSADGYVEVLDGIREGEKIVVSSQFLIDSESNLKAAIGQMAGHTGMDMSKTVPEVEEQKPDSADKQHDMSGMQMKPEESAKPAAAAQELSHDGHSMKADTVSTSQPAGQSYTCEMHPQVVSDKPGDCPLCGMKLVLRKNQ